MTVSVRIHKAAAFLPALDELIRFGRDRLAKATLPKTMGDRTALFEEVIPAFAADLAEYFDELLARAGVKKDVAFPLDVDGIDWATEKDELGKRLLTWYTRLGDAAYAAVNEQLQVTLRFDLEANSTKLIRHRIGEEVQGITSTLQETLRSKVETAVAQGMSIEDLVAGKGDVTGLRDLFGSRAQTIALTETANAYNSASLAGYAESGLVETVMIFDGPDCGWTDHDDPDLADGSERDLDDAYEHLVSHPNCQRAMGPVVIR
jgi:hypothetical protein